MTARKKKSFLWVIGILGLILIFLGWFLSNIFEGEKPRIEVDNLPEFLSDSEELKLTISDTKRGLKTLEIAVEQEGRRIFILEKEFPFRGLLNSEGVYSFDTEFVINPVRLNLAQGRADLHIRVWDYSRRSGGDGNLALIQHKMIVDTIAPAIRALSKMHNVNVGGSGLVVYQTSSDTVQSGVFVNDIFFPGFFDETKSQAKEGYHVCYFAIPHDVKANREVYLWAKDRAGNISRSGFYYHIRKKRFRTERMNITERFLERVLPYFSFYQFDPQSSNITRFLRINREMRYENSLTFRNIGTKTGPMKLWSGTWLRLRNAANMARFGDRRLYFHKGEKIDEQIHLGVDLASLANSEVQCANNGRVIFADRLGIYGFSVIVDHGQGLASVYGHLSKINVELGQDVMKGSAIGLTGQTGLAGGDHLHFGVMVSGVFVNPVEWWDPHWIQDNITAKLALLDK